MTYRFARSGQMIECLKSELLYSDKRARDALFRAVAHLVTHRGESMIVSRLTREAAALARREAASALRAFTNWETTAKAVVKAMMCAKALLTPEQQPIPLGVAAHASIVGGLIQRYEDFTEAFLIEFLIRKMRDITTRDHRALAHALFRHFDQRICMGEFEDRVVVLIAGLVDRIELHGDRYFAKELAVS